MLVLIGHFVGLRLTSAGWLGVLVFFVLSGRLMCELLFVKKVRLGVFFFRRCSRVLPTFWLFVIAMWLFASYGQEPTRTVALDELVATLTFLRAYFPANANLWSETWPTGHLWSLNVEEHSYAALGLIAAIAASQRRSGLAIVMVATCAAAAIGFNLAYLWAPPHNATPWALRSECASISIMMAATLVLLRQTYPKWVEHVPALLPILTFLIAVCLCLSYPETGLLRTVAPASLAFTIVTLDRIPRALLSTLSLAPLRWLGRCSFSLYLWQQPFYLAVHEHRIHAIVGIIGALIVGTLSYYAFENPMRNWLNDAWARRTGGTPSEARKAASAQIV